MTDDKTMLGTGPAAPRPVDDACAPTIAPTIAPEIAPPMAPIAAGTDPGVDETIPPTVAPTPMELAFAGAGVAATIAPDGVAATLPPTMGDFVPSARKGGDESFVGRELCGYTIKHKLAEGGMGVVLEGEHGKIGRRAAIKLLKAELCRSDEVVERFYQEARAVNAIRHQNIVDIYDFGRDADGRVYFVMEFLEGEALSARIQRGALPWSEAYPILEQTLRALRAAHDKGFVHRDLKPDNIWLGKHGVKLLDFGIAKLVGADEKLTQTGSIMGTPHYMSPEQINGSAKVDHRTDLYALGVIAFEMFAGKTPFVGDTLQAVITGHLFTEAPRLTSGPIVEIVDRLLAKDPDKRYQRTEDVLSDLDDVRANRAPTKAETLRRTMAPAAAPPAKTSRAWLAGGAAALLATGGVLAWVATRPTPEPAPAPVTPPAIVVAPAPPPSPVEKPIDYVQVRKDAQVTLRASIKEAEPVVRVQGSDALAKIKDTPSVPALSELAERDPDAEARGHAADALGTLGATGAVALLGKLEAAAEPPLKVWYASALARLGDKAARARLIAYAGDKDLRVSFKAGLALADQSRPGDAEAIRALEALARREAELNDIAPYAGAVILTKLAALHDPRARKILYAILDAKDEGSRLAAAEGLARLGDDAGRKVLEDVGKNVASPNRLAATVALVPLGDYSGYDFLTAKLADKDVETRRLAARGLGEIGERKSVRALVDMTADKDWTVRVAAAGALMAIVGLDPQVLAQASVDWTRSALGSEDWAVRKAAAGVLGDMPEKQAVPLLAAAIADPDPKVRAAASHSAGKMKSAEAATRVAAAARAEKDPAVKEEQVKALGAIGNPAARETLVAIAADPGRVGVFAAGSLVAVGDKSGKAKLDGAVVAPDPALRLAAVQSASAAKDPIVVGTLATGIADVVFDVKLAAAEGLAGFGAEKARAVPVLTSALTSKDAAVQGRASSALLRFGEKPAGGPTAQELLDSPDPKVRLAAIPIVRELPPTDAVPLLRRLVADPDGDVRRGGVDAIATFVPKAKDEAVKLYKPLVSSSDAVVRSVAQAQLSRLVEPLPPPPTQAAAVPAPADTLPKVKDAVDAAAPAAAELASAVEKLDALDAEIAALVAHPAKDDAAIKRAEQLATEIDEAAAKVEAAATRVEAGLAAIDAAAGASPSGDAAALVTTAQASAASAHASATASRSKSTAAAKKARDFAKAETVDPQTYVAAADAAIATGSFGDAKRDLDRAARIYKTTGARGAGIDYSYAQLYDKMAVHEKDPAAKRRLLELARGSYEAFAKSGSGSRVQRATDRAAEIADDIRELGN